MQIDASPRRGDRLFKAFNFTGAIKAYEKHVKKNPTDVETIQKLATAHRLINNWPGAEEWYRVLNDLEAIESNDVFHYATALRSNQKYEESNKMFEEHYRLTNNPLSKSMILSDAEILDLLETAGVEVSILSINSKGSDFGPVVYGDKLYFTSNRASVKSRKEDDLWSSSGFLNMYMADTTATGATKERQWMLKKINDRYHEGPAAFHPNGDIYLTRTNYKGTSSKANKGQEDIAKLGIYRLKKTGENTWSDVIEDGVSFNNIEYSVAHATFNEDGSIMYFTSDMPGGLGSSDVWKATWDGTTYSNPENLGASVNTIGNDMFPYYKDGKLYFSSTGWQNLGGLDIFVTNLDGREPKNIGAPINTSFDDFAMYITNETTGYFTSNRPGIGGDDIYRYKNMLQQYKILVYDIETNEPLEGAEISTSAIKELLKTDKSGEAIMEIYSKPAKDFAAKYEDYSQEKVSYNRDGYYATIGMKKPKVDDHILQIFVLDYNTKEPIEAASLKLNQEFYTTNENGFFSKPIEVGESFDLFVEKETGDIDLRYFPERTTFSANEKEKVTKVTVLLRKLELNKEFLIREIYYDLDDYSIREDAAGELNNLYKVMKEYPSLKIELRSHTDCRHSKSYNMNLSIKRAKSAMDYLIKYGISKDRMTYQGFGETMLVNDCACEADKPISQIGLGNFRRIEDEQVKHCTEEQHQMNRRTTFMITDF